MTSLEPEIWDHEYATIGRSDLLPRLARQGMGPEYLPELRMYGWTTRALLRRIAALLSLAPGQTLVDLAAGEGGAGLWLAAEHEVRLTGIDFAPAAVASARVQAERLAPSADVRFRVGTFTDTGLKPESVDALICLDALFYFPAREAAFAEIRRVLRPGGRFAVTGLETHRGPLGPDDVADFRAPAEAAGLRVLHHEQTASWPEGVVRTFTLWLEHADELRADFGEESAGLLLAEAADVVRRVDDRRHVLLVGER